MDGSEMKKIAMFVFLCLLLMAVSGATAGTKPVVGDLLVEIAHLRGIAADDAVSAERDLRASGIDLPVFDLRDPLTEGAVVGITRSLGLHAKTSRPDAGLDAEAMTRFLVGFAVDIGDAGEQNATHSDDSDNGKRGPYPRPNDNAADPLTKGKGKKKGLPQSPSHPH